jgi:hypothetical protein
MTMIDATMLTRRHRPADDPLRMSRSRIAEVLRDHRRARDADLALAAFVFPCVEEPRRMEISPPEWAD